jgi:hypothetical protein
LTIKKLELVKAAERDPAAFAHLVVKSESRSFHLALESFGSLCPHAAGGYARILNFIHPCASKGRVLFQKPLALMLASVFRIATTNAMQARGYQVADATKVLGRTRRVLLFNRIQSGI